MSRRILKNIKTCKNIKSVGSIEGNASNNQLEDEGANPIPTLQINARDLVVYPCSLKDVRNFIETNHYSHNVNGVKVTQCFKVQYQDELVGAVLFGSMATTAWKKFSDKENKVLELRRLVLIDSASKNSESRVIGWCLRYIKKNFKNVEIIVSYADPYYGHDGTIYKATNFECVGLSAKDKGYLDKETNRVYHSRALRTKYKGEYKPFVKRLRNKLNEGILIPVELPQKYCYVFKFKRDKS